MTRDLLTDRNNYRSSIGKISTWARLFPGLVFYRKLISIVWKASRLAKRGRYSSEEWIKSSLAVIRLAESLGIRIEIENLDSFRKLDSPCVIIGNHMSTFETFALPAVIQPYRDVTFVVKRSLVVMPVFRHVMISRDPVVVGRADPREDLKEVMEKGRDILERGISIIVFPQTTRAVRFDVEKFNSIGVKLARRAGVPVIPLALKTDAWGLGRLLKDVGPIDPRKAVHFAFGNPLRVEGGGREQHQAVVEFIEEKLREWS